MEISLHDVADKDVYYTTYWGKANYPKAVTRHVVRNTLAKALDFSKFILADRDCDIPYYFCDKDCCLRARELRNSYLCWECMREKFELIMEPVKWFYVENVCSSDKQSLEVCLRRVYEHIMDWDPDMGPTSIVKISAEVVSSQGQKRRQQWLIGDLTEAAVVAREVEMFTQGL